MRGEDVKYSKYNSSGLYACNSQQGVEDISFDQLFWEISQENFQKFFKMLECAKGNDFFMSTHEVIHRRQRLDQSLR